MARTSKRFPISKSHKHAADTPRVARNSKEARRIKRVHVNQESGSVLGDRLQRIQAEFPEVFGEGKVDFGKLRAALGDFVDSGPERYTFSWAGKRDAVQLLQMPSRAALVPVPEESMDFDNTGNVFIEGENLEVLKLLYKSYFGRVKMIYIDPPYNTGGDLVYRDNYTDPLDMYLRYTGQKDTEGNLLTTNPETSGRYHSTWLSMMYPRLFVARQLLRDDGALFVSCNDIEQAHLRLILNEIFGEENFAATLIWNNEGNIDNQSKIKTNHEYIHMYARSLDRLERPTVIDPNIEETSKLYRDEIENSITKNGPANPPSKVVLPVGFPSNFESGVVNKRTDAYPYLYEDARIENSVLVNAVTVESGWSSKNLLQLFIDNGFEPIRDAQGKETRFALTLTGAIYGYKTRTADQGHVLTVIRNVGTTKQNSAMLAKWGLSFDWPKPVRLIEYLCQIATGNDGIILDFFAGSCTTAHAVLNVNRRDGGTRRFVMVQLPEPLEEPVKLNGRRTLKTIADIGIERIRRVRDELKRVPASAPAVGIASDLGFRVFKLAGSNFKPWTGVEERDPDTYTRQMEFFADSLADGWSPANVLWEVAVKEGYSLTSSVQKVVDTKDATVYRVTDAEKNQSFHISLDAKVNVGALAALNLRKDDLFVCRDSALDDSAAANLALQCRLKTI